MKPRHAAALALVGWYLMVPPTTTVDAPPFKYWRQEASFDSAHECKVGRDAYINHYERMSEKDWNEWDAWFFNKYTNAEHSLCAASDDPRLKGN
jgi:hypothetical protein